MPNCLLAMLSKLALNDFIADVDVLDLSANGYSLAQDGYFPTAAPLGAKSVREVITLKLQGTSKDDLAAMTQEIDEKIKQVEWWLNDPGVERYQVWIRVQLENESLPRQAQIISIQPPDTVRVFTPEERIDNFIGDYQIGIERTPFWEDPYPYPTTNDLSGISTLGGMVQFNETIYGDVPARLPLFSLLPNDSSNNGLTDFWIGFRTSRLGNPANFQPVWDLKDGSLGTDATTTADANANSGTRITVSFATDATLVTRAFISMQQSLAVLANSVDQRGTFTLLMRARCSDATTTCRARVLYAITNSGTGLTNFQIYRGRQVITTVGTGADYQLWEMGKVTVPPYRIKNDMILDRFSITVQAERIAGSGSLYLDCLVFIPTDEGATKCILDGGITSNTSASVNLHVYADDTTTATHTDISKPTKIVKTGLHKPEKHFDLPANGEKPYIILAASQRGLTQNDGNKLGGSSGLTYFYIPRWRTLRGNST